MRFMQCLTVSGSGDDPRPGLRRTSLALLTLTTAAATLLVGGPTRMAAASVSGSNASTPTTTAPLTLAEWKQQFEPAIGQIADDALVVFDTGKKNARHPTKQKVKSELASCRRWLSDAQQLPDTVPPIPLASAEKVWQSLIRASVAGSSDCVAALGNGSSSVVKDFHKQLVAVDADENRLVAELGGTGQ